MTSLIYTQAGQKPMLLELERYVRKHRSGTRLVRVERPNRTVTSWILQQAMIADERGAFAELDPRFKDWKKIAVWLKKLMKELENT